MPPQVHAEPGAQQTHEHESLLAVGALLDVDQRTLSDLERRASDLETQKARLERAAARRRRKRWPTALPEPPADSTFTTGDKLFGGRPDPGWLVEQITKSNAWKTHMVPAMVAADARAKSFGPERRYKTHELEAVYLYRLMARASTMKEARALLAGDTGEAARKALGFDSKAKDRPDHIGEARHTRPDAKRRFDGVPSEATLSRHRRRFPEEDAIKALDATLTAMIEDRAEVSEEFREALRLVFMDGTSVTTDRLSPRMVKLETWKKGNPGKTPDPEHVKTYRDLRGDTSTVVCTPRGGRRPKKVTALDAGYVGGDQPSKAGDGWRAVIAATHRGEIVGLTVGRNGNDPEPYLAEKLLENTEVAKRLRTARGRGRAGVLVADAGFSSNPVRHLTQNLGFAPCISARTPGNSVRVAEADAERWAIHGHPKWHADGHRNLVCDCGHGLTYRRFHAVDDKLTIRVEGDCRGTANRPGCGSVTVTVGEWRAGQKKKFWKIDRQKQDAEPDMSFGNGLTYHDPLAKLYGKRRFGAGEALMEQLDERWNVTGERKGLTTGRQVVWELLVVALAGHAAGMAAENGDCPPGMAARPPRAVRA